jgi:NADP-dependent 3-hydroxy acid dehydrogenase YdfG
VARGASRGFGRRWAEAALEHGDGVAATARAFETLKELTGYGDAVLPIRLDVTDRDSAFAAVAQAAEHFGRLDVVVNNAGYGREASSMRRVGAARCVLSERRRSHRMVPAPS